MSLLTLIKAGITKRWHTKLTLKEQSVAEHSWGVAMIVNHIYPNNAALIMAALTHDLHEIESGDIPYPFKKKYPEVGRQIGLQEDQFCRDNGIDFALGEEFKHALKWADMFELYLYCRREISLGNQLMYDTLDTAFKVLRDMGPPNERAEKLFKEAL